MIRCPSCSSENAESNRFCGSCAAPLTPVSKSMMPTLAAAPPGVSSGSSVDEGRFLPGTLLAGRYRIIGLLGRGGMGEVYRATDLTLGQPVALKFLPGETARDDRVLARFHNEVRIARQVSHPNVCRVYDIGSFEGQPYISMEYIDGEDLGSLLRRIGRLPTDKAVEIARKLCAGLAAAHDKGVLHRDLKPANVMIDGRGNVLIMDFGLAAATTQIHGGEVRHGTPAYMAPEQLAGKEVSVKSDIYALGLVLYEMFTGKRAFEADTMVDLVRMQNESSPARIASVVTDVDPSIERVILRCLDPDPRNRPASPLAIAAALPGGDPLAAALAAGETPSPEMVAAAGETEGMPAKFAIPCLAAVLIGLVASAWAWSRISVTEKTPFENPPEALALKARDMVQRFGYTDRPQDRAYGFSYAYEYLQFLREKEPARTWERLAAGRPPAVFLWYRQSPRYLAPVDALSGAPSTVDPPETVPGMVRLHLDTLGRLMTLIAVPPQLDQTPPKAQPMDWKPLFDAAGLDQAKFTPAEPQWVPPKGWDQRSAWTGSYPEAPAIGLRIEAAAWRGRPVYFELIGSWRRPASVRAAETPPFGRKLSNIMNSAVLLVVVIGAIVLARRNTRLGRGDRRGAFRLAAFVLSVMMLRWLLGTSHIPSDAETGLAIGGLSGALLVTCLLWVAYQALEPYVRRRWPQTMISWGRILAGKLRDPLVGSHLLIGMLAGIVMALIFAANANIVQGYGASPRTTMLDCLLGPRHAGAYFLRVLVTSAGGSLFFFLIIFFLRGLVRKQWLAAVLFVVIFTLLRMFDGEHVLMNAAVRILINSLVVFVLIRHGLVSLVLTIFVVDALSNFPLTLDFSSWYGGFSVFALLLMAAIAGFGFHSSLAGRPLMKEDW